MAVAYSNNASTTLSATITNSVTSLSVATGDGAEFPSTAGGDHFYITLTNNAGDIEIMKVTARSTDTFTVVRGQDGTSARGWAAGDRIELRLTKAMLDDLKGERALSSHTHAAADITSGTLNNARVNFAAPDAIGSTTPNAGTFTSLTATSATSATITTEGDSVTNFTATRSSTDNTGPTLQLRKARGTTASRTAVSSGDAIGGVVMGAYGGTNFRNLTTIRGIVDTYTSDSDISAYLNFLTTPAGSVTAVERMRLDPSGTLLLRQSSNSANTSVSFNTSAQNALTLDSSGFLGVGVTPSAQLDVLNSVWLSSPSGTARSKWFYDSGNSRSTLTSESGLALRLNGNTGLQLLAGGNGMYVNTSGDVGIGSASTGWRLEQFGTGNAVRFGAGSANDNYTTVRIDGGPSNGAGILSFTGRMGLFAFQAASTANDYLRVDVGSTNVAWFTAAGHLGVGVQPNANWADGATLQVGQYRSIGAGQGFACNLGYYPVSGVYNWRSPFASHNVAGFVLGGVTNGVSLFVAPKNAGAADAVVSVVTALTVTDDGKVGIGTNTPGSLLQLSKADGNYLSIGHSNWPTKHYAGIGGIVYDGNDNTRGSMLFYTRQNNTDASLTERMRIDYLGNVGIGVSGSPGALLELSKSASGAVGAELRLTNPANALSDATAISFFSGSTRRAEIRSTVEDTPYAGNLQFSTGTGTMTARMTIVGSDGNVGINTTAPANKLTVINTGGTGSIVTAIRTANLAGGSSGSGIEFAGTYSDTAPNNAYTAGAIYGLTTSGSSNGSGALLFYTQQNGTNAERMKLTSSGELVCGGIYSATVGATNRDVYVDNGGLIGYVSSIRASKTNINDITDVSWLHQLNPVSYQYRKKDEDGNYTDEADGPVDFGLIAEDTESVKPELCFYDEVDGEQELRGINYSKLIVPMLKAIQEQQQQIDALKAEVATLH